MLSEALAVIVILDFLEIVAPFKGEVIVTTGFIVSAVDTDAWGEGDIGGELDGRELGAGLFSLNKPNSILSKNRVKGFSCLGSSTATKPYLILVTGKALCVSKQETAFAGQLVLSPEATKLLFR